VISTSRRAMVDNADHKVPATVTTPSFAANPWNDVPM
jgi:hypothetical protein